MPAATVKDITALPRVDRPAPGTARQRPAPFGHHGAARVRGGGLPGTPGVRRRRSGRPRPVHPPLGALSFSFIVEGLLVSLLPRVGKWLPGGAPNALVSAFTPKGGLLPIWAAALVLLGYAVVLGVVGARFVVHRDVT